MDLASLVPILVALVAGGGVAMYTARPRKESLIAEASEKAVGVVSRAIERLEEELKDARERIAILEHDLAHTEAATARALQVASEATTEALRVASEATSEALRVSTNAASESDKRIAALRAEIAELEKSIRLDRTRRNG